MKMGDITTIRLKRKTKRRLDGFFEKKGETYDDILNRILDRIEELEK